ncbi:MAG: selenide, water dikinase SelD, partial [Anaerolineales bacterium]|nr:selenide, water dikinase SelD [Anaerolineales bacterium]
MQPLRDIFAAADHPDLLVGLGVADDAAVYKLNENQAIINTTDFFPPVVDDPYDYGAIAAANALSDVYAMGGEVLFAMNIVGFPDNLDRAILQEILRGGAEKVAEA